MIILVPLKALILSQLQKGVVMITSKNDFLLNRFKKHLLQGKVFEIVDGPGKFDLATAMFDKKSLTFTVRSDFEKFPIICSIQGLVMEDGSGQSFLIKTSDTDIQAYYHLRTKSGTFSKNKFFK